MADSQGSVERPVRNVADVEFFFVAGMAAGGTRPTVARREFRDWLAERDRKAAVEAGVCEHQNANYLRMMSERDEARQQLADLRAGIEALADTKPGATGRALRALLSGSGEQPGERARCSECGPGYRVGDEGCRHRPAPALPDSADVREALDNLRAFALMSNATGRAKVDAWHAAVLAVVRPSGQEGS